MKKFFSLHSGTIYEVSDEEASLLDLSQIPLLEDDPERPRPKPNCKHCFGRGWAYKEKVQNIYQICRCLPVNWKTYEKKKQDANTLKNLQPISLKDAL